MKARKFKMKKKEKAKAVGRKDEGVK